MINYLCCAILVDYSDYSLLINSVAMSKLRPRDQIKQSSSEEEIPWVAGFFKVGNPEAYKYG